MQSFLDLILASFHLMAPAISLDVVAADPDDDKILECAIASKADSIVPGDSHLQELGSYRTVEIVNPAEFLDITDKKPDE